MLGSPPSPKAQDHDVGFPVEASVNLTVWPVVGLLGEKLKPATGGATFTVRALLTLLEPPALPVMRLTLNMPGAE